MECLGCSGWGAPTRLAGASQRRCPCALQAKVGAWAMCFLSDRRLLEFMDERVYPAEPVYEAQLEASGRHRQPAVMEELEAQAMRARVD